MVSLKFYCKQKGIEYTKLECYEYGRCAEDPVMLKSVPEAWEYLQNLKLANKRDCECFIDKINKAFTIVKSPNSVPIDRYEILFQVIENACVKYYMVDVYICCYSKSVTYYSATDIQLAFLLTKTKQFYCRPPSGLFYKFNVERNYVNEEYC